MIVIFDDFLASIATIIFIPNKPIRGMPKEDIIKELAANNDPRSIKWEFRAILDTLQELDCPCPQPEIQEALEFKYGCQIFDDYNHLYNNIQSLIKLGAVTTHSKKYVINPKYSNLKIKNLPISNYSVALFSLSAMVFVVTAYLNLYVQLSATAVIIGGIYLLAQYFGSEFELRKVYSP